jgi:hypothetical protein
MTGEMDFSHVEQVRAWLATNSDPVAGVAEALLSELVDALGASKVECYELKCERSELKTRLRRIARLADPLQGIA